MSRTSIPVSDETRDRAMNYKHENESWDEFVNRVLGEASGDSDEFVTVTSESIDEIADAAARKTIEELEIQQTRP